MGVSSEGCVIDRGRRSTRYEPPAHYSIGGPLNSASITNLTLSPTPMIEPSGGRPKETPKAERDSAPAAEKPILAAGS
jgi:hypothetical protein